MKNYIKNRTYIVYSSFVADFLLERDEKLITIRPNLKNPSENVFVFANGEYTHSLVLEAKALLSNFKSE
jgi:hypothetical protein